MNVSRRAFLALASCLPFVNPKALTMGLAWHPTQQAFMASDSVRTIWCGRMWSSFNVPNRIYFSTVFSPEEWQAEAERDE